MANNLSARLSTEGGTVRLKSAHHAWSRDIFSEVLPFSCSMEPLRSRGIIAPDLKLSSYEGSVWKLDYLPFSLIYIDFNKGYLSFGLFRLN